MLRRIIGRWDGRAVIEEQLPSGDRRYEIGRNKAPIVDFKGFAVEGFRRNEAVFLGFSKGDEPEMCFMSTETRLTFKVKNSEAKHWPDTVRQTLIGAEIEWFLLNDNIQILSKGPISENQNAPEAHVVTGLGAGKSADLPIGKIISPAISDIRTRIHYAISGKGDLSNNSLYSKKIPSPDIYFQSKNIFYSIIINENRSNIEFLEVRFVGVKENSRDSCIVEDVIDGRRRIISLSRISDEGDGARLKGVARRQMTRRGLTWKGKR